MQKRVVLSNGAVIMNEVIYWSATKLARAIREKSVSSSEAVSAYIQRIEQVNPKLNAMIQPDFENALLRASLADQALMRGQLWGPLHGVPFSIKDSIETAGVVCTGGTLGRKQYVPKQDAVLVNRLKKSGAILLGKTNVPELCLAYETDNLIIGRTNNPYHTQRSAGGSSGGEAALIAAGGSPLGLGSDAGGSIRFPAHCCGIAGLKPTSGRLPRTGHFIPPGGVIDSIWQIGPMARAVEDLFTVFPLLLGVDWMDASVIPMPYHDPYRVKLHTLRVGYYFDNHVISPAPEIKTALQTCVHELSMAGLQVEATTLPAVDWIADFWIDLLGADGGTLIRQILALCHTDRFHPLMETLLERCGRRAKPTTEFCSMFIKLDRFRSEMLRCIEAFDVLISPVNPFPSIDHGTTYNSEVFPGFSYTIVYNLTGWPAAVVRCGATSDGMPVGVQIAAKPWREDLALAVARYLEERLGGWIAPPIE